MPETELEKALKLAHSKLQMTQHALEQAQERSLRSNTNFIKECTHYKTQLYQVQVVLDDMKQKEITWQAKESEFEQTISTLHEELKDKDNRIEKQYLKLPEMMNQVWRLSSSTINSVYPIIEDEMKDALLDQKYSTTQYKLECQISKLYNEIKVLQTMNTKLTNDCKGQTKINSKLIKALQIAKKRIDRYNDDSAQHLIQDLQQRAILKDKELVQIGTLAEQTQLNLEETTSEKDKLDVQLQREVQANKQQQETIQTLAEQIRLFEKRNYEHMVYIENLQADYKNMGIDLQSTSKLSNTITKKTEHLERTILRKNDQITSLEHELSILKTENSILKQKSSTITTTTTSDGITMQTEQNTSIGQQQLQALLSLATNIQYQIELGIFQHQLESNDVIQNVRTDTFLEAKKTIQTIHDGIDTKHSIETLTAILELCKAKLPPYMKPI